MNIIKRRINTREIQFSSGMHPILQRIFNSRGITSEAELSTDLKQLLPFKELMGIETAAARLADAINKQERILIVGDFDADGATSSALAVSVLRSFGGKHIDYLVPNRFAYGYGLSPEIVEIAARWKPNVIVTVDNGISSIEGVDKSNKFGIDVIITDHHLAADQLPDAYAIVNPNQPGDNFKSKNLAGVGVIFYVMAAVRQALREQDYFKNQKLSEPNMTQFLDLVALGTVADVVPLDRNNRLLVAQGLKRIRAGQCRPGILALLKIAKRDPYRIATSDLGFAVAPRLNAAGRLDDMSLGIDCLLTDDSSRALEMASELDSLNQERRAIESSMKAQALDCIKELHLDEDIQDLPMGLCLYEADWHQGVVGIVASRIKDILHRPVIAFAKVSESELKGSARSVSGVHIRDALDAIAKRHPELISKFGGHAMAAGLSLDIDKLIAFQEAFDIEVKKHLTPEQLVGEINSDGELTEYDFNLELSDIIKDASPWGQGFPEPLFDNEFKLLQQRIVGEKHLKCVLGMNNKIVDAIAFNVDLNLWPDNTCDKVHVAYRLESNEYQGNRKVQLIIEQISRV